jgi:molybdate transport system substrate-binding protein
VRPTGAEAKPIVAAVLGAAGIWMVAGMASAAEFKVLSSNAIKQAYLELLPQFEHATGHKVTTTWAGTGGIMSRIERGEVTDLVIMSSTGIDTLIKQGKLVAGSRVDLVRSGIGIAVRAGAPKPDISSADALKRALQATQSVAYSTGPSGVYLEGLFQRLGIADEVKAKSRIPPSGNPVGDVVARGEAEIGFQQISELLPIRGIDYVGPLPADVQHVTVFAAGLFAGAKEPEAAKALIRFITAPAAVPVIKKTGMEPG